MVLLGMRELEGEGWPEGLAEEGSGEEHCELCSLDGSRWSIFCGLCAVYRELLLCTAEGCDLDGV